jgi:hypothetical protein
MDTKQRLIVTALMVSAVCVIAFAPTPHAAQAVLPVVAPTTGWVTQGFGGCPTQGECHAAIDIAGPPTLPGNPVYSMAAGVVILRIQQSTGFGCHMVIDHGNQGGGQHLYSLYSHLGWKDAQGITQGCYFNVALNQQVSRGQQIGKQGNSGLATGTHLHFGVYAYPPPWSGAHHAIDPGQCIGFAPSYTALSTGPGCGPGTCPHDLADGCLLRAIPSNRYFVFFGGARFQVPNDATRTALYGSQPAWDISDQYADSLTDNTPRDGTLLRDSSNGWVYVVFKGARFHVPNETVLKDLYCPSYPQVRCSGDLWHDAVIGIPDVIPDETILHDASDGRVYVIVGGARFHIPDETVLYGLYCEAWCAGTLWHDAISAIPASPRDGTLVHDVSSGAVHVTFGGARFHVPDEQTLSALYCPTYPQPGCWTDLWHAGAESIPVVPAEDTILREQPDPKVFSVCAGERWWIPSEQVFNANGYQWGKLGVLWPGALSSLPQTANTDVHVAAPGDRLCDTSDVDDDNDTLADVDETGFWMTNPLLPDSDGDSRPDSVDNCPTWANPQSNLPSWPIIPVDADCDGFTSVAESRLGTNQSRQCAQTGSPDDEALDAWPVDLNDDRIVDSTDMTRLGSAYNTGAGSPGFNPRFDLNGDRSVDVADLVLVASFYGKTCS